MYRRLINNVEPAVNPALVEDAMRATYGTLDRLKLSDFQQYAAAVLDDPALWIDALYDVDGAPEEYLNWEKCLVDGHYDVGLHFDLVGTEVANG